MTPQALLTPTPAGLHELRIVGHFYHPHWVAFLFSGLAVQKISVVGGKASQSDGQQWSAQFDLDFSQSGALPSGIDFVSLAENSPTAPDREMPRLTRFEINQLSRGLEVHLSGPDQIGFLGRLLRKVSLLALFPVEIEINTIAGSINDRILFRTIEGPQVGENVRQALDALLRDFLPVPA